MLGPGETFAKNAWPTLLNAGSLSRVLSRLLPYLQRAITPSPGRAVLWIAHCRKRFVTNGSHKINLTFSNRNLLSSFATPHPACISCAIYCCSENSICVVFTQSLNSVIDCNPHLFAASVNPYA